jgi:hypothetical protein
MRFGIEYVRIQKQEQCFYDIEVEEIDKQVNSERESIKLLIISIAYHDQRL